MNTPVNLVNLENLDPTTKSDQVELQDMDSINPAQPSSSTIETFLHAFIDPINKSQEAVVVGLNKMSKSDIVDPQLALDVQQNFTKFVVETTVVSQVVKQASKGVNELTHLQ